MATYIVRLAPEPEPRFDPATGYLLSDLVEHEGYVKVQPDGTLEFRTDIFESPYIGYASSQWLRFEKKEI